MSIFIAPDAEGDLTVWADVPGKDPVALLDQSDVQHMSRPIGYEWDPRVIAAQEGGAELWQLILDNVHDFR